MKKYNEFKYELGNDENGERAWINPVLVREGVTMEERFANDLNDQFVNSGVKYVEVEEEKIDSNIEVKSLADDMASISGQPAAPALENTGVKPEPPIIPAEENTEGTV